MPRDSSSLRVTLFYSYSHKDTSYRQNMQTHLATLRERHLITDWSDAKILPGRSISDKTRAEQRTADIVAFLISPAFLDSPECLKEWDRAKRQHDGGRLVFRVPIILRACAWKDFLGEDDVKALPCDGKPIKSYRDRDLAWQEVYDGIKTIVNSLRTTYTPKLPFLDDLNNAGVPSSTPLTLSDIFVFPRLTHDDPSDNTTHLHESVISSVAELRTLGSSLVYGPDKCGKTALAKHLTMQLINDSQPVLFWDVGKGRARFTDKYLKTLYEGQFNGDYSLWANKTPKTLVIDNLTETAGLGPFLKRCRDTFDSIYIFVSSDVFLSFLIDDARLTHFTKVRIEPLQHTQQETLIKNRASFLDRPDALTDGFVDYAEDRVNSIIIANKIVPRYPFFVLSILQTFDTSIPLSLSIISYGHCYQVFILTSLHRAGISRSDESVNACFNFLERLALHTFERRRKGNIEPIDFGSFRSQYRDQYFIQNSLVNRLIHKTSGLINEYGEFKYDYMYYFVLGKLFAEDSTLAARYLPELCDHSYTEDNYLTLLFTIHHARDDDLIQQILTRTTRELVGLPVASLTPDETARFASIVAHLPASILSTDTVKSERTKARQAKDDLEEQQARSSRQPVDEEQGKDTADSTEEGQGGEISRLQEDSAVPLQVSVLRVLKNNKILGQVVRNQSGKLRKTKIETIVSTVADSSFRLINVMLKDEDEIAETARLIHEEAPEMERHEIQHFLEYQSFVWTIMSIGQAVDAVGAPSIREAVDSVVIRKGTPAYRIFGYLYKLDMAATLTTKLRDELADLYKEYRDDFVRRVLSIRTQAYMNTHRSKPSVEQSICAVLGIDHMQRLKSAGLRRG